MPKKRKHTNKERTVICPVEGCDKEMLARGAHLHVMRTDGNGHGPQNDVPESINFDDLETAGEKEVSMNYPESRDTDSVKRLCPFCEKPFRGQNGVIIHLSQVEGRSGHPENASEKYDAEDFPIAEVDEAGNIIDVVEPDDMDFELPSTRKRRTEENLEELANLIASDNTEEAKEFADEILD